MKEYNVWVEAVMIYLDNAYAAGASIEETIDEIKQQVSSTELGNMDWSIDRIVAEWKTDREIV